VRGVPKLGVYNREQSLPVEPDLLHAAVETSSDAILITSAAQDGGDLHILYVNPSFTRMTGYTSDEVVGKTPRILQGPLTDTTVLARLRAALADGAAFQGEAINYRKDGSTYVVEWTITPVRSPAGAVTHWVSTQRDISERRSAQEQQELMVRELHHRVRNTLTTVQAIMGATVRTSQNMGEFQKAFGGRMTALARTHTLLTEGSTQAVPFQEILRAELAPYEDGGAARIVLQGPPIVLPSDLAVPVGMAVHELTTNAAKHGALAKNDGRVEVSWSVEDEAEGRSLWWQWNEHDGPPVELPTREGFGSRLLKRVLTDQVSAEVQIKFEPDGLRVEVRIPLPAA